MPFEVSELKGGNCRYLRTLQLQKCEVLMPNGVSSSGDVAILPGVSQVSEQEVARLEAIWEYDLSPVKDKLSVDGDLPADVIEEALVEYRKFMGILCLGYRQIGMHSKTVDKVWHAHILFTRDYAAFCESVFGEFIHHEIELSAPRVGGHSDDSTSFADAYERHFGELGRLWTASNSSALCYPTGQSRSLCYPTGQNGRALRSNPAAG